MKITATTQDAYQLIHDGVLALARAERQGIRVDTEYCEKMKQSLTKKIDRLHKKIEQTKFFKRWNHIYKGKANVYSNPQLSNLLYKHMKIEPPKKTATGEGATDEEALKQIDIPELKMVLEIRKLSKVLYTYLESFVRETNTDGYMRPSYNLHLVRTYRSSSADPNFQNIPKRDKESMKICRRAILPRPGHLLAEADFSSVEVMIGTCYHKDPVMMKYLNDKSSDMHGDMAKQIYFLDPTVFDKNIPAYKRLRQGAKNGFVFPQFYGDYYGNNARSLCEWADLPKGSWAARDGIELPDGIKIAAHLKQHGLNSFDQFLEHMKQVEDDFWNRRFKVYHQWRENWVAEYQRKGYLKMLTGFTCSGVMRKNEIFNYPVQGTAFHCLLKTFIKADAAMRKEKWDSKLIGQIHDSIVMDIHPDEINHIKGTLNRIVREELPAEWPWIIVPLEIELETYKVDGPWIKE